MLLVEQLTESPQEGLFICILHSILLMHNKTINSVQHFQPDFSLFSFISFSLLSGGANSFSDTHSLWMYWENRSGGFQTASAQGGTLTHSISRFIFEFGTGSGVHDVSI